MKRKTSKTKRILLHNLKSSFCHELCDQSFTMTDLSQSCSFTGSLIEITFPLITQEFALNFLSLLSTVSTLRNFSQEPKNWENSFVTHFQIHSRVKLHHVRAF
jgi:hypothetical protein